MIRAHFGLDRQPFALDALVLLPHQAEVLETLRVHCQQGGLCLVVGEPGTGKSVIKQALVQHDPKRLITPVVNRSLHTYSSVLRVLCQAFFAGSAKHAEALAHLLTLDASAKLHGLPAETYFRDLIRVLPFWPEDRYLELCPREWAKTRARLDDAELRAEVGTITVPPPPTAG